jgi:hypothetical protein
MNRFSFRPLLTLLAGIGLGLNTLAHDVSQDPLPTEPGWRVGTAVAITSVHATQDNWPTPRWPGTLGSGQLPSDRRGTKLEHGTLDLSTRINSAFGAYAAWGQHGSDPVHVEAARLEWKLDSDESEFILTGGRDRVPMGSTLTRAGHFDRFAQAPLVKSVVLNDDWIDDGLLLRWQSRRVEGWQTLDGGVWRGRTFPGGPDGPLAPALHLRWSHGELDLDGFAAQLQPRGRGTMATASRAGHTHAVPSCLVSTLVNIVCFDGTTRLLGGSARWTPHDRGFELEAALLYQHDSGALYTKSGDTQYTGRTAGGWVDGVLELPQRWSLAARGEWLTTRHDLSGPGATAVAADAGLTPNSPLSRLTVALLNEHVTNVQLSLEAGTERGGALPPNHWIGLRAVLHAPLLLSGRLGTQP